VGATLLIVVGLLVAQFATKPSSQRNGFLAGAIIGGVIVAIVVVVSVLPARLSFLRLRKTAEPDSLLVIVSVDAMTRQTLLSNGWWLGGDEKVRTAVMLLTRERLQLWAGGWQIATCADAPTREFESVAQARGQLVGQVDIDHLVISGPKGTLPLAPRRGLVLSPYRGRQLDELQRSIEHILRQAPAARGR
jgi:hypothetical protein